MPSSTPRYEVLADIASGGMGTVQLAMRRQGAFQRLVAIKRLTPALASDADARAMFLDEARFAGLLHHPNVVAVSDFGEDEHGPYLVMEYVEGVSLASLLGRRKKDAAPLPVAVALEIGIGVARGLESAHQLRDHDGRWLELVHRDVSPHNVLLSFEGAVQVTDFGIAKAVGRSTRTSTGVLKGKLAYMAPELLRFEEPSVRSDLFSLGVVLFETLALERPFAGDEPRAVAREILNGRARNIGRSDVPEALRLLIGALLRPEPKARPESAALVAAELSHCLEAVGPETGLAAQLATTFAADRRTLRARIEALSGSAAPTTDAGPSAETLAEPPNVHVPSERPRARPAVVVGLAATVAISALGGLGWAMLPRGSVPSEDAAPRSSPVARPEPVRDAPDVTPTPVFEAPIVEAPHEEAAASTPDHGPPASRGGSSRPRPPRWSYDRGE